MCSSARMCVCMYISAYVCAYICVYVYVYVVNSVDNSTTISSFSNSTSIGITWPHEFTVGDCTILFNVFLSKTQV